MDYMKGRQEQRRDDNMETIARELREIRRALQSLVMLLSSPNATKTLDVDAVYRLDFVDGYMGAVGSYFTPDED